MATMQIEDFLKLDRDADIPLGLSATNPSKTFCNEHIYNRSEFVIPFPVKPDTMARTEEPEES